MLYSKISPSQTHLKGSIEHGNAQSVHHSILRSPFSNARLIGGVGLEGIIIFEIPVTRNIRRRSTVHKRNDAANLIVASAGTTASKVGGTPFLASIRILDVSLTALLQILHSYDASGIGSLLSAVEDAHAHCDLYGQRVRRVCNLQKKCDEPPNCWCSVNNSGTKFSFHLLQRWCKHT